MADSTPVSARPIAARVGRTLRRAFMGTMLMEIVVLSIWSEKRSGGERFRVVER